MKSGAFCPDVVVPGVALEDAEIDLVHGLVVAAESAAAAQTTHKFNRPRMRCGFDPHHAIVLYDKAGTAIAKFVVCFSCTESAVIPGGRGVGGGGHASMMPEERAALKGIFDKHGLATWPFEETESRTVRDYEFDMYGPPDAPTPAGVDRHRKRSTSGTGLDAGLKWDKLAPQQRERLCAYATRSVHATGATVQRLGETGCLRRFQLNPQESQCGKSQACSLTVEEIEACFRAPLTWQGACEGELSPQCGEAMKCLDLLGPGNG